MTSIVVISDLVEGWPPRSGLEPSLGQARADRRRRRLAESFKPRRPLSSSTAEVRGGYLERLPMACVKYGLCDFAEIWHHWRGEAPAPFWRESPWLARRTFALRSDTPPFTSNDMLAFLEKVGAPDILVVLGLGVSAEILEACSLSIKIYNSIDAPGLRIPVDLARTFHCILTGSDAQTAEVQALVPGMRREVLPIGPEFADPDTFRPLEGPKPYDLVYVAAAQPYKRHDILFSALERLPRSIRALCVFGYGEAAEELRADAARRGLAVDFIGPPGVLHHEVNQLMNLARIGVVCGIDDGAPAVLTEYMLAGLPVLANAKLRCGLQFITPATGGVACAETFHEGILQLLELQPRLSPRETVLDNWTWPHSIVRFAEILGSLRS